jgi:tRNA (cmo5U34)-methyltransferase
MNRKDRLYDSQITKPGDFVFDNRVVNVFPDMINRSVPGYGQLIPMIGMLARRYAQSDSNLYDLGCSLGAVSLAMRAAVQARRVRIFAIDNSIDMIARLEETLQGTADSARLPVLPVHQDILETRIEEASVVVINFTLQFVDPAKRQGLLTRVAEGLRPGGVLILSEKVRFEDPNEHELQTNWHHDFKRAQGYTDLEIARKRDALENVMKPDSLRQHRQRLEYAGFEGAYQWFQGFNFVSLLAFR